MNTIKIHDAITGEIVERELSLDEIAIREKEENKIKKEIELKINAKNLILQKLGITEEEAKLLLS